MPHIENHIEHCGVKDGNNTLYVVGVCSNPASYNSRYRLARKYIEKTAATKNVHLTIVEGVYEQRHPELKELCEKLGVDYVQIQLTQEIWVKEPMMNIGVRNIFVKYPWAQYICWEDMDIEHRNPHWAQETIQQLQHFHIVQPWQSCVNLGPTGNIMKTYNSVGEQCRRGTAALGNFSREGGSGKKRYSGDPYIFGHCGYSWACSREFWENVQGLIDFAILGSADHHMALGCRGYYSHSVHSMMGGTFKELIHAWQHRAMQLTHGHIGWVNGRIEHFFHGSMPKRNYVGRWEILIKNNYDPVQDLQRDCQGMIKLVGKPQLEHDIMMYNRNRCEDSIDE